MSLDKKPASQKSWKPAPKNAGPATTGQVIGVWLAPDEDVQWNWSCQDGKRIVTGYQIVKNLLAHF
jgi:hypothetical protein